MRYPTLPQEGVFMEALIWANEICNAKFDWFSRKETKSTYEKQPFSTRETRFLIWAFPQIPPPLGNASFDWILLKETKSTYEKQPFSEEKPQDRVNPLLSPNFRNEERKIIKEGTRHTRHTRHSNTQHATRNTQQRTHARNKRTQQTHATTQRFFSADLAPVIILTPICGGVHGTLNPKIHYGRGPDDLCTD